MHAKVVVSAQRFDASSVTFRMACTFPDMAMPNSGLSTLAAEAAISSICPSVGCPRQSSGPQHDLLDRTVAVACRITKTAFHQSCELSFHVKLFGCPDRVTSARLRMGLQ
jgi:hypothetical protein